LLVGREEEKQYHALLTPGWKGELQHGPVTGPEGEWVKDWDQSGPETQRREESGERTEIGSVRKQERRGRRGGSFLR